MNNSLGFLLAYKSAKGLPKNKRLLYGILGAQGSEGDISQAAIPILLAKKEIENQPNNSENDCSNDSSLPSKPNKNNEEKELQEEMNDILQAFDRYVKSKKDEEEKSKKLQELTSKLIESEQLKYILEEMEKLEKDIVATEKKQKIIKCFANFIAQNIEHP